MSFLPTHILNKPVDLETWLTKRCDYVDNVFEDPGYSEYYKNHFNIYDERKEIYGTRDIDYCPNTDYVEDLFNDFEKDEIDTTIEQYLDFVPRKVSDEFIETMTRDTYGYEKQELIAKLTRKPIAILPGSNRSNANYLFKALLLAIDKLEEYSVPFVSTDPTAVYTGEHKEAKMILDKKKLYNFVFENSKK